MSPDKMCLWLENADFWLLCIPVACILMLGVAALQQSALNKAGTWMQGAVKSLFPSFLEVAGRLVQAGQAGCQAAGSHLYALLFAAPTTHTTANHQQVCVCVHVRACVCARKQLPRYCVPNV